MKTKRISQTS